MPKRLSCIEKMVVFVRTMSSRLLQVKDKTYWYSYRWTLRDVQPHKVSAWNLMANREKWLTVRKYFNQGFLDADGRFARDVECLLTAVESKQVSEDASIVFWQSHSRPDRGQPLTASTIKDQNVLLQMMQADHAYRFLKNVRGSPAYFQRAF